MKYQDWLNEWLEYYVKPTAKDTTYGKYRRQMERHILPVLGNYDLNELSAIRLQRFTADLTQNGLAANTVNGIISVLKSSLKKAVVLELTDKNAAEGITRPKTKEKRVECFSVDEQKKIERYISSQKKKKLFGIVFCFYTGLRIGELTALKWSDFDLTKGIVAITKSCRDGWKNGNYEKIVDTPKTEHSRRVIPFPKQLLSYIKEMKRQSKGNYFAEGKGDCGVQVRSYQKTFSGI